jgi:hypothetical protein
MISMVWPDIEVTISPGRWALPSGMFSTRPMMPTTLTLALRAASACIRPVTQAAPPMSPFMSSMPPAGLIEMPPVSKTDALADEGDGLSFGLPPFQRMIASGSGRTEPCATPSSAPMPSFFISFSSGFRLDAELLELLGLGGELLGTEHVRRLVDEVAGEIDAIGPPTFSQSNETRSSALPRPITKIRSALEPSGATRSRAPASFALKPAIFEAFATTPEGSAALAPAARSAPLVCSRMA